MNRDLEAAIADLRHAYTHLAAERVVKQREFADGLLAPAIRVLEALADAAKPSPRQVSGASSREEHK